MPKEPWYSDADTWSALAAWTALGVSVLSNVVNFLRSRNTKTDAKYATDRADAAVAIAERAQHELEKLRSIEQERDVIEARMRDAPVRAKRLIVEARQNAEQREMMNRSGKGQHYEEPNWITGQVGLRDETDRLALSEVARDPSVTHVEPGGTSARISFVNPRKRK